MISLYIHIPFCQHKCGYCSFHVIPQAEGGIITSYLEALHRQIDTFGIPPLQGGIGGEKTQIRTIYFGGGTPSIIGAEAMAKIIDHIATVYDLTYLEELSIEINPEPVEQMIDLITTISKRYKNFPRVRFSIGIQSFDNEVLEQSNRQYNYQSCVDFLRKLVPLKTDHNVFNLDFIAFGKFNKTRKGDTQLRDPVRLAFFQNLAESSFIDSFSLYTLELFEGSEWYNQQIPHYSHIKEGYGLKKYGSDEEVYEEFEILKSIILDAGYRRYEISNYSLAGKNSIHNRVYRSMGEWLGLGTGATSYLSSKTSPSFPLHYAPSSLGEGGQQDKTTDSVLEKILSYKESPSPSGRGVGVRLDNIVGIHFTTVSSLKEFTAGNYIDDKKTEYLTENDYMKEKFLMGMRTMEGISNLSNYKAILVANYEEKIALYTQEELCTFKDDHFALTDSGMDVYNSIISEMLA